MGFALNLADEIARPALRATALGVLGDPALERGWLTAPCTRSGHHAYQGGLLEHTVGVAALAQTLSQWHPRLAADLLLTAALVHDVGHIRSWRLGLPSTARFVGDPSPLRRDFTTRFARCWR